MTELIHIKLCLADVPLKAFLDDVLEVDGDAVTELIHDQHNAQAFSVVASMTVGEFRDWLVDPETDGKMIADLAWGLTPEMAAAVSVQFSSRSASE